MPFGKKAHDLDEELSDENTNPANESSRSEATNISNYDEDQESGEGSLSQKLKTKIFGWKNKTAEEAPEESVDEFEDPPADTSKKKRNSRIIQVLVGVGILVIILLAPTEEEPVTPAVPIRQKGYVKRPAKNANTAGVAVPAEPAPSVETDAASTGSGSVAETPASEPAAPEPEVTEAPAVSDAPVEPAPVETPPVTEPSVETPVETAVPEPVAAAEPTVSPEPAVPETPADPSPPASDTGANTSEDSIDGQTAPTADDNLTEQMLRDLEKQSTTTKPLEPVKDYVAPPDYEYRGRGLVYNCSGKHWACVDGPTYKICEQNSSSNKFLGKSTECHPHSVFENQKGCENVQKIMVSSSFKTGFCVKN